MKSGLARRIQGDPAPRPERQFLPGSGDRGMFAALLERGGPDRRDRLDPVRHVASAGFRAGSRRGHGRRPPRLPADPSSPPIGLDRRPRPDEPGLLAGGLYGPGPPLRDRMPGISLSTDIIVGFPGETEAEFAETLTALERSGSPTSSLSATRPARGRRPRGSPTMSRWKSSGGG